MQFHQLHRTTDTIMPKLSLSLTSFFLAFLCVLPIPVLVTQDQNTPQLEQPCSTGGPAQDGASCAGRVSSLQSLIDRRRKEIRAAQTVLGPRWEQQRQVPLKAEEATAGGVVLEVERGESTGHHVLDASNCIKNGTTEDLNAPSSCPLANSSLQDVCCPAFHNPPEDSREHGEQSMRSSERVVQENDAAQQGCDRASSVQASQASTHMEQGIEDRALDFLGDFNCPPTNMKDTKADGANGTASDRKRAMIQESARASLARRGSGKVCVQTGTTAQP
eukprot:749798-Hanusia_phi.AAC.2